MINIGYWWVIYIFAMILIGTTLIKYIKLKFNIKKNDSLTVYWFIFTLVFFVIITKYFLNVGIVTY